MYKYVLKINGMRCGMCEAHIEDTVRKKIKVKRVNASHIKNELTVITDMVLDEKDFHILLDETGYIIDSFEISYAKKTFLGWK